MSQHELDGGASKSKPKASSKPAGRYVTRADFSLLVGLVTRLVVEHEGDSVTLESYLEVLRVLESSNAS